MTYAVKEIYYTLQGEGVQAGRPAIFLRFSGCNLWSGREDGRARAICTFCDTDFVGVDGVLGDNYATPGQLAKAVAGIWPAGQTNRLVVCTGGEPTLQLDTALIEALHDEGFEVAVESNGTRQPPAGVDWLCISPKAGATLVVTAGDELKLVYPQDGLKPADLEHLNFKNFLLQPMDGDHTQENIDAATKYCMENPRWRLSLQLHKVLGLR